MLHTVFDYILNFFLVLQDTFTFQKVSSLIRKFILKEQKPLSIFGASLMVLVSCPEKSLFFCKKCTNTFWQKSTSLKRPLSCLKGCPNQEIALNVNVSGFFLTDVDHRWTISNIKVSCLGPSVFASRLQQIFDQEIMY